MNKSDFLSALQRRIRILTESEQTDILAEYAQHIDLRMRNGLSEEEAIQDFGDLNQLAAEILEAYHVDSSHLTQPAAPKPSPLSNMGSTVRSGAHRVGGFFRSLGQRIAQAFHRFCALFHRSKPEGEAAPQPVSDPAPSPVPSTPTEKPHRFQTTCRNTMRSIGRGARSFWRNLCRFTRWALRWIWNLFLVCCGVPLALLTLALVLLLGLVVVFLFQGYPLIGVLIATLGGILVCSALLGLGWTTRFRRQTALPAADPEEMTAPSEETEILSAVQSAVAASFSEHNTENEVNDHA